jgi:SAM-dependent methyltransferase
LTPPFTFWYVASRIETKIANYVVKKVNKVKIYSEMKTNQQTTLPRTGYGIDVAIRRADDLDRVLLKQLALKENPQVLDIGCGAGGQSLRMVEVGASVCGVDIYDYSDYFRELRKEKDLSESVLEFIQADVVELEDVLGDREFDDCCMQRVLHYLPYSKALEVLGVVRGVVEDKLYISVTGLDTYLKEYYEDRDEVIAERFCGLSPEGAELFHIENPVCLYTQAEFETLLKDSGWKVEKCWVSDFGNIKAVCSSK